MYCSKCGAQNADGSQFCNKCGAAMNAVSQSQPISDAFKLEIEEARHNERVGWVITIVGIAGLVIGGYMAINQAGTHNVSGAFSGIVIASIGTFVAIFGFIIAAVNNQKREKLIKKLK